MKSHAPLTGGPNTHKSVIAYMSDIGIIPTAIEPLSSFGSGAPRVGMTVSLDQLCMVSLHRGKPVAR
jgi:hypothetical protein